jgi:hypothetical protein
MNCPICASEYYKDGHCTDCGYVPALGLCVQIKPGRCANGSELGGGSIWHATKPGEYKALCGTKPGRLTPGWSSWHYSNVITCPKCLKKWQAMQEA